jgi:OmpA-OmpF porin, OOP family
VRILLIIFISGIANLNIYCQKQVNLISNSGFELLNNKNYATWFFKGSDFNRMMKFWFSPTGASPDVYTPKTRAPANWDKSFGMQKPHTGNNYVGITTYGCVRGKPHCREYISIELNEPLIIGQEYDISFFTAHLLYGKRTNNLGVTFTVNEIEEVGDEPLHMETYVLEHDIIKNQKQEWSKISGRFIASEESNYLVIGNFYTDDNTKTTEAWKNPLPFGYYYIDDVTLVKVPPILRTPIKKDDLTQVSLEIGKTIVLKEIHFDNAKFELHPRSYVELNKLLKLMKEYKNMEIEMSGHTDSNGDKFFNKELSLNRAKSVVNYLIDNGIDKKRMSFKGFGDSKPVSSNETSEGRRANRRVEFKIVKL